MWTRRNPLPLIVVIHTYTTSMKMSVIISQRDGNWFTPRWILYHSWEYTQRMVHPTTEWMFIAAFILIVRFWEQTRSLSMNEKIKCSVQWSINQLKKNWNHYIHRQINGTGKKSSGVRFLRSGIANMVCIPLYVDISS